MLHDVHDVPGQAGHQVGQRHDQDVPVTARLRLAWEIHREEEVQFAWHGNYTERRKCSSPGMGNTQRGESVVCLAWEIHREEKV